jgi:hypothetical protein
MNLALDNIFDEVSKYSLHDQEMILGILQKRLIDGKRDLIFKEYKKAMKDYRSGKVKTGSTDDLFDSLK